MSISSEFSLVEVLAGLGPLNSFDSTTIYRWPFFRCCSSKPLSEKPESGPPSDSPIAFDAMPVPRSRGREERVDYVVVERRGYDEEEVDRAEAIPTATEVVNRILDRSTLDSRDWSISPRDDDDDDDDDDDHRNPRPQPVGILTWRQMEIVLTGAGHTHDDGASSTRDRSSPASGSSNGDCHSHASTTTTT